MKRFLAILYPTRSQIVPDPETTALHARLDRTIERLDRVLHTLQRRLSSKGERPHLAVVRNPRDS